MRFPGFGQEYWRAVLGLDYPMIMGLTLFYAIGIVLINLLIEVLMRDPGSSPTFDQTSAAHDKDSNG